MFFFFSVQVSSQNSFPQCRLSHDSLFHECLIKGCMGTCTLWIESFQNKDHTQGFHEKQETEGNHCLLQSSYLHVANIFGYHRCIVSTKCITVLLFTDSNYILSQSLHYHFYARHVNHWTILMQAILVLIMRPISVTIATGPQSSLSCTVW